MISRYHTIEVTIAAVRHCGQICGMFALARMALALLVLPAQAGINVLRIASEFKLGQAASMVWRSSGTAHAPGRHCISLPFSALLAPLRCRVPVARNQFVALRSLHVGLHHFLHQSGKVGFGGPAEFGFGFGRVA